MTDNKSSQKNREMKQRDKIKNKMKKIDHKRENKKTKRGENKHHENF